MRVFLNCLRHSVNHDLIEQTYSEQIVGSEPDVVAESKLPLHDLNFCKHPSFRAIGVKLNRKLYRVQIYCLVALLNQRAYGKPAHRKFTISSALLRHNAQVVGQAIPCHAQRDEAVLIPNVRVYKSLRHFENKLVFVRDIGLPINPLPLMMRRILARYQFRLLYHVIRHIQIEAEKLI
ncbi:hypothetical protein [Massilia cavernae]|uniref:Uncharacterized protein n=1 Tax=Massilia cavernae TaxID=2320864 RepID=A0A418XV67_9BURK|nr:hypothetical protein [Massilia cavernae]RJG16599.1 hypothetical protein D3872_10795 [Massilia cavernae]